MRAKNLSTDHSANTVGDRNTKPNRTVLVRMLYGLSTIVFVTSLGLCVASVFMWGRSYWWVDNVIGPASDTFRPGIASANGWLTLRYANPMMRPEAFPKWTVQSRSAEDMEKIYKQMEDSIKGTTATYARPTQKLGWKGDGGVQFPYWMLTATTGVVALVLGWKIRWQFGLRTLFVAITAISIALGLLVALFRNQ